MGQKAQRVSPFCGKTSGWYKRRQAKAEFLRRMQLNCVPASLIEYVNDSTNYFTTYNNVHTVGRPCVANSLYLVLPFHRVWFDGGMASVISAFSASHEYRALLQQSFASDDPFRLNASWRLCGSPLGASFLEW